MCFTICNGLKKKPLRSSRVSVHPTRIRTPTHTRLLGKSRVGERVTAVVRAHNNILEKVRLDRTYGAPRDRAIDSQDTTWETRLRIKDRETVGGTSARTRPRQAAVRTREENQKNAQNPRADTHLR